MKVERALVSVSDKAGLESLVDALSKLGAEIVASSGTAARIREMGYGNVKEVSEYTGHPESPGGLLKTLHPKIHGGLLLDRENPEHRAYMKRHGIRPFDLVVVNLYPFEAAAGRGAGLREAAENIDIGGPTMIRAAAKAALLHDRVAVVVDPSQYGEVVEALRESGGTLDPGLRRRLAEEAFKRTAEYDAAICGYLEGREG